MTFNEYCFRLETSMYLWAHDISKVHVEWWNLHENDVSECLLDQFLDKSTRVWTYHISWLPMSTMLANSCITLGIADNVFGYKVQGTVYYRYGKGRIFFYVSGANIGVFWQLLSCHKGGEFAVSVRTHDNQNNLNFYSAIFIFFQHCLRYLCVKPVWLSTKNPKHFEKLRWDQLSENDVSHRPLPIQTAYY